MDRQVLIEGSALIVKDFRLEPESLYSGSEELTYDLLLARLTKLVDHLIDTDFHRLINILYRIDVSEENLKQALAKAPDQAPEIMARMILERELQKVETRRKYSS